MSIVEKPLIACMPLELFHFLLVLAMLFGLIWLISVIRDWISIKIGGYLQCMPLLSPRGISWSCYSSTKKQNDYKYYMMSAIAKPYVFISKHSVRRSLSRRILFVRVSLCFSCSSMFRQMFEHKCGHYRGSKQRRDGEK